jgi:hypothetical protein
LSVKIDVPAGHQWDTPVVLATQEIEITNSPLQIVLGDPILKIPKAKRGLAEGPEGQAVGVPA